MRPIPVIGWTDGERGQIDLEAWAKIKVPKLEILARYFPKPCKTKAGQQRRAAMFRKLLNGGRN